MSILAAKKCRREADADSVTWNETAMTIAGTKMHLTRGGSGRPVLVLHHDIGTPDRLPFYDTLAQSFDVLVPHHPGWGKSERPQWLRSVRDIAAMHSWLLADLGAERRVAGGAGLRRLDRRRDGEPGADRVSASWCWSARWASSRREGDIADQAIVSYLDYPQAGFHDQAAFTRVYGDVSHRPARGVGHLPRDGVPHRLEAVHVQPDAAASAGRRAAPALVVWGDDDRHVPKQRRRGLREGAAQCAAGNRRRLRALCRYGEAGRAGASSSPRSSTRTERHTDQGSTPCT